jgi:hypothetical protein
LRILKQYGLHQDDPGGYGKPGRYSYAIDMPPEVRSAFDGYGSMFTKFKYAARDRERAATEKAEAEAEDLWHKA